MNYQTINAKELTQKAVEKHGSQYSVAKITGVNHAFVGSQAVVNSPCFVVYPANSTAILRLSTGVITDPDITVLLRMNGHLLDSSDFTNLAKHQTIFSNG